VHGAGDHGFVPMLIDLARKTGVAAWVGDGANRWPAVHRADAADLARRAVEHAFEPGTRFHVVAEEGIAFRAIAEVIARKLGVPAEPRPGEHFGWFAHFAALDRPAASATTRARLGWTPVGPGLLADLDAAYF
jgi:nucleoside-diphosphate-sugar epimerase